VTVRCTGEVQVPNRQLTETRSSAS
jgi:hypothetical protein